jgi:hypothetical protein
VVVAVIAVLVALLLPSLGRARQVAKQARAASDMHQMLVAYVQYTTDNNGSVLLGFLPDTVSWSVYDPKYDITISGHEVNRYPWRFLAYIRDWRILFNNTPMSQDTVQNYSYTLSLLPRFGLNSAYVGGDHQYGGFDSSGRPDPGSGAVFKDRDASRAGSLIVFGETVCWANGKPFAFPASSLPSNCPADDLGQYFQLLPPSVGSAKMWHVDQGRMVADSQSIMGVPGSMAGPSARPVMGFFDGHAEAMRVSELGDMSLWANVP